MTEFGLAQLRNFPSAEHARTVCQPNTKNQCRYVGQYFIPGTRTIGGAYCSMNNERQSNGVGPTNCDGLVGLIRDNADAVVGQTAIYADYPFFALEGPLKSVTVDSSRVITFDADWEGFPEVKPRYIDPIIKIEDDRVVFSARGQAMLGNMAENVSLQLPEGTLPEAVPTPTAPGLRNRLFRKIRSLLG